MSCIDYLSCRFTLRDAIVCVHQDGTEFAVPINYLNLSDVSWNATGGV